MELLPSLMCCAFKTCHATQSVGLLFSCAAEMISRGFVCWLFLMRLQRVSPLKSEWHSTTLCESQWVQCLNNKKVCLQFIIKKMKFASKKMFKTVYASRNQPPHTLCNLGFSMPSHYSDWKYSSLHILLDTAWLHIETLRSQSFVAKCCYYSLSSKIKKNIIIKALKFL